MTRSMLRAATLLLALPIATATAQQVRVLTPTPGVQILRTTMSDRPMLGVTLGEESERADTLGLRVDDVRDDSPAAKAGIKDGDRLQAINGVSLRADRADAGEEDYDGVLLRRLQREMAKVKEGDTITLRVLSEGRARDVRVLPVSPETLYENQRGTMRRVTNDRAVIGVSTQATGNARDTLGVFIASVTDEGPAAKAGLIEGDRIAAINGVSLRVAREDAGDQQVAAAKATRLRNELDKVAAGAVVELTVVSAGRSRTVRVTTVKASELPGNVGTVWGFSTMPVAPTPPTPPVAPTAPRVRTILRGARVL